MREWILGRNPVFEVLRANRRQVFRSLIAKGVEERGVLRKILLLTEQKRIPVDYVDRDQLESLGQSHQGVAAEVSEFPYSSVNAILERGEAHGEDLFVLFLDTLKDPQNLGTLLRTAEVAGIHGICLPYRRTATVTPAVVSASSGASEHLLVAQSNLVQAIHTFKEAGLWIVGLDHGAKAQLVDHVDLKGPLGLVVGSEGKGMRRLVRDSCDFLLRLPMRGKIDSLNAAVAGSIALYLAWQARGFTGAQNH